MHLDHFKELMSQHKDRLYRQAKWMMQNSEDAEDIVQEVFTKIWSMRGQMDKYHSPEGLLVQMAGDAR